MSTLRWVVSLFALRFQLFSLAQARFQANRRGEWASGTITEAVNECGTVDRSMHQPLWMRQGDGCIEFPRRRGSLRLTILASSTVPFGKSDHGDQSACVHARTVRVPAVFWLNARGREGAYSAGFVFSRSSARQQHGWAWRPGALTGSYARERNCGEPETFFDSFNFLER